MIWLLAVSWIILNLLDVFATWRGIQVGAIEIGFLYQVMGNLSVAFGVKLFLAGVVVVLLVQYQKMKLLAWLDLGMLLIVTWNMFVLSLQVYNYNI